MEQDEYQHHAGEKVEEINSEITEIIGLQKKAADVDSEFGGVQAYDALIGKIETHIRSRAKHYAPDFDNDVILLDDIIYEHRNDQLENINSEPRVKDWNPVMFMHIGNDLNTKCIVPSENYQEAREGLERLAYARLKEKRVKQYRKMLAIIADEFELHKNLIMDVETQEDFEDGMFDE